MKGSHLPYETLMSTPILQRRKNGGSERDSQIPCLRMYAWTSSNQLTLWWILAGIPQTLEEVHVGTPVVRWCSGHLLCPHPPPLSLPLYLLSAQEADLCRPHLLILPIPPVAVWQEIRRGETVKSGYWVKGWLGPSCQSHNFCLEILSPCSETTPTTHYFRPGDNATPIVLGQDTAPSLWVLYILSHISINSPFVELSSDLVCHLVLIQTLNDTSDRKIQTEDGRGRARAGEVLKCYKGSPIWFLSSQVNAAQIYWPHMLWFRWGMSRKELTVKW